MSLYSNIWGHDYDNRLQAVRALTLAFLFLGALRLLTLLLCGCCGGEGCTRGAAGGWSTTIQVLCGWAGWLIFLWILLDIRDSRDEQRAAQAVGVQINIGYARDLESYWGHSFWLFLAATVVTTIGGLFGCC
jgi:hypothetical protein